MALLLDLASDCEVELVDGCFIVYSAHPWKLCRPKRFAAVYRMAEVVGRKVQRRTIRYRDDRVPTSAAEGTIIAVGELRRRLRARPTLATVVSTAAPLLIGALGVMSLFSDSASSCEPSFPRRGNHSCTGMLPALHPQKYHL